MAPYPILVAILLLPSAICEPETTSKGENVLKESILDNYILFDRYKEPPRRFLRRSRGPNRTATA